MNVVDRLAAAGCVDADGEAAQLVGAAPDDATLEAWVHRRERGEPLAWITGATTFCGNALFVSPGAYVPRPQTEELAARAASVLPVGGRALDLCTGVGAIAVHLRAQVPSATVVGVDIDRVAAQCARRNGVAAVVGDVAEPIVCSNGFDVVTAVAPYVPTDAMRFLPSDVQRHEPRRALDGGDDGLDVIRRVISAAARLLRRDGCLLLEVGADQDALLAPAFRTAGFEPIERWRDEDGDLRGLSARLDLPGGS